MNILYSSALCSSSELSNIFSSASVKPGLAIQKFHRLLVEGFVGNGCSVSSLSALPVSEISHNQKFWRSKKERVDCVDYYYPGFINFPFVRQLALFLSSVIFTIKWCLRHDRADSVIICDVLNVSVALGSWLIGKLLRFNTVAIVTDLPNCLSQAKTKQNRTLLSAAGQAFSNFHLTRYDKYIILTEQMNELVNPINLPYIVMEGLVDINMKEVASLQKEFPRTIIYAGGIYEKYGVKKLIEAFMRLEDPSLQLSIYGPGEMAGDMPKYCSLDPRIKYFGTVPNEQVVKAQLKATLLVNPRSSAEEFTKYSFPSKNMEYMVSGTPVLTTKLPGMPKEYYSYVYLFENEDVNGFERTLRELLHLDEALLAQKGIDAKRFVLAEKNNLIQAGRVLGLCKGVGKGYNGTKNLDNCLR